MKVDSEGVVNRLATTSKDLGLNHFGPTEDGRWEICVAASEKGFQQMSFVNSIATTKVDLTNISE